MTLFTRKNITLGIAAILVLTAGSVAVKKYFSPQKVSYITAPVTRMDLEDSVLATGILKAFKTVAVGAQVNGQLKTLHVALGDSVKKGQLLAEIDPVLARNTLRDAEAQVKNLQAQKRSKQALLTQYELSYKRQSEITAGDAGSRADLESARAQMESTRYDIDALGAQINQAIISVDTARANFGYTRINAPIDGTVISIDTEEGQTVVDRKSTRLNSSHNSESRMPSSA
jgi:macrolide-specific efflux system membrane fusion protein